MKYARILEKGVLIKSVPFDGAKPYDDTPPDAPDGMYAVPTGWEETETSVKRTWQLVPMPDDIDDAEAYNIIFGGTE
jgi:hypothetical protein